jgi:hypothetical protein
LGGGSGAVLEAPAFVPGFDDVAVMCQAVEESGGHFGVPEYHMMPLTLIGESLTLRLLTPVTPYLEPVYG